MCSSINEYNCAVSPNGAQQSGEEETTDTYTDNADYLSDKIMERQEMYKMKALETE